MNRKALGLVAAIALAAVGTIAIVAYVNGAEDRALAGEKVVRVLVVKDEIPAGTPAEDIGDRVELERVNEKVKADGAVTTVTALQGKVASATLVPGEQVVERRFVESTSYRSQAVDVPDGLLQTTISVSPDRAVGGVLTPGTLFAVSISLTGGESGELEGGPTGGLTHLRLRKVLVTSVQTDDAIEDDDDEDTDEQSSIEPGDAPSGNFLVTLALSDVDTEHVVWAAEHGSIWLSVEPADAPVGPTKIVTPGNVLQ